MIVTAERIKRLCPGAKPAIVAAIVDHWDSAVAAGITKPVHVQYFMATAAVETGGLKTLEENLRYSSAARLCQVWPSRFKSEVSAKPYVNQPRKLANLVYANRLGNGPPQSDDGWRYRGSGVFQTTGASNFEKAGYRDDPDALRRPVEGFIAALEYWQRNRLSALAERGNTTAFRKAVNGGTHGLAEFNAYLAKARGIFTNAVPSPARFASIAEASTVAEVETLAAQPDIPMADLKPVSSIARVNDNTAKLAAAGTTTLGGGGVIGFILDRYQDTKDYLAPVFETFEAIPGAVYFVIIVALLGFMWWQSRFTANKRLEMERTGESLTTLKANEAVQ